jgi:uncharacterized membrane protein HdeD (DUF308 family)
MTEAGALPVEVREARDVAYAAGPYWWILLITGSAWILFSIIVLRFDPTSVTSISIVFGCAMLAAAAVELFLAIAGHGWARLGHGALTLVCLVVGIVAFAHPGNTFRALAAVFSFYLVIKGTVTVILTIAGGRHVDMWWLSLITGFVEIGIGFWAAGYWGRSSALLLAWIGIVALMRGIGEIVLAFTLRKAAA